MVVCSMGPCNELAACLGCHAAFAFRQLGEAPVDPRDPELGKTSMDGKRLTREWLIKHLLHSRRLLVFTPGPARHPNPQLRRQPPPEEVPGARPLPSHPGPQQ